MIFIIKETVYQKRKLFKTRELSDNRKSIKSIQSLFECIRDPYLDDKSRQYTHYLYEIYNVVYDYQRVKTETVINKKYFCAKESFLYAGVFYEITADYKIKYFANKNLPSISFMCYLLSRAKEVFDTYGKKNVDWDVFKKTIISEYETEQWLDVKYPSLHFEKYNT